MRRWLTLLVFVLALAVPAFAQQSQNTQQQGQAAPSSQQSGGNSSSKQTSTTTTTTKTSTPVENGINPLYLAIGAVALITIIAIALLAARSRRRGRDTVATVRETTVIKE